jgi:hypothetical protein
MTLAVTLSDSVTVNAVNYQVSGNGIMPIAGSLDVTSLLHPTVSISGIPAGSGYAVTLDAVSVDSKTTCRGMGTFSVAAGQTATVNVILLCHGAGSGGIMLGGRFDNCPFVESASTEAAELPVRGVTSISASATDYDDADVIGFTWTLNPAALGIIGNSKAPSTTFRCNAPGLAQLNVTVSDGACGQTRSAAIAITCKAIPPNASDAGADGPGADVPVGADAPRADASVEARPEVSVPTYVCPVEPVAANAACQACTASECQLSASGTDGCCTIASAPDRALCAVVAACFTVHAATCTTMGDGTNCFCGDSGGACFMTDGAANGPCTAEVIAAAKTSSASAILNRFTNPGSALGRGVNLVACRGAFCSDECGIP